MKKKFLIPPILLLILLLVLILLAVGYDRMASPTRIGFIGFRDQALAGYAEAAGGNSSYVIEKVPWGKKIKPDLLKYDVLMIRGMGLRLTPEQKTLIKNAIAKGVPVYVSSATSTEVELSSIPMHKLNKIQSYYRGGGVENQRRLLNYLRREIDGKRFFVDDIKPPVAMPRECLYHIADDAIFPSYEKYLEYYKAKGFYKEKAPRVFFMASRARAGGSGNEHIKGIIKALEDGGLNVFPVSAREKQNEFISKVKPDILIWRTGAGRSRELFEKLNLPVFCPVNVYRPYDKWLKDQRGFTGGLLTWNIVWPETDGRIVPYAVTAQFPDKRGFNVFKVLPKRLKNWVNLVKKYINLRKKDNSKKKIVIIYYKGPGQNALNAQALEVGESLFNVLKRMREAGYNVEGLPENADELLKIIQKYGKVLGAYAKGSISEFLRDGNPELVSAEDYVKWAKAAMPADLYADVEKMYGQPPGEYLTLTKDGKKYLAISRVRFGNVVIMPLPMAGSGPDTNKIVHGTKKAPPHAYIGVYLWARFGFKADALVHFGTHGSVEFTPWKQNALSSYDWPDILMGSVPHSYIYSINNIGEAVLAKRRTYAVMVSHLTAPFMAADLHGELDTLHEKIAQYEVIEQPQLRAVYNKSICEMVRKLNLEKDLSLKELKPPASEETIEKIHNYLHEVGAAKINRGRYVIDRPYTDDEAMETARQMTNDPIARAMAELDLIRGKITSKQLEDLHFYEFNYRKKAEAAIDAIFQNRKKPEDVIGKKDSALLASQPEPQNNTRRMGRSGRSRRMGRMRMMRMRRNISPPDVKKTGRKSAEELLLNLAGKPESLEFIASLKDEEKYKNAIALTNPRSLMKEMRLAVNLPERRKFLKLAADPQVMPLLTLMKDGKTRSEVLSKLSDPEFKAELEAAGKKFERRMQSRYRRKLAGLDKRRKLYQDIDIKDIHLIKERIAQLKKLAADYEFLIRNRNGDSGKVDFAGELRQVRKATARLESKYKSYLGALKVLHEALSSVKKYKHELQISGKFEVEAFLNSLNGGYVKPSPGGDPIVNPRSIPTGKNLYPIDDQIAPTRESWEVGKTMAQSLIDITMKKKGHYPKKVAFTLWGGEFIRTYGAAIGQIFYLLGVEPVWNSRGVVYDVRLIPMEKLKRPRIDVVIQTSGQFRDTATSRIYLIDKAVRLASNAADDGKYGNYVKEGNAAAEKVMIKKGLSPVQARKMSKVRIFGGAGGAYGTGICGLVEAGDKWENEKEIADRYLKNMGAVYTEDCWCQYIPGVFEAALQNTDTVVHSRSSNTWGPLSLDHVYEFMGGINLTIRSVTGKDPDAYFLDLRQPGKALMKDAREAAMMEARSTLLNPKYIKEMMEEGPTGAGTFAETFRNTYAWEVMKPDMLEDYLWEDLKHVYVDDSLKLGIKQYFEKKNPYALQEMTAVMLETIRKGYWKADKKTQRDIAKLHAELIKKFKPGCSGFVCNNKKLMGMISSLLGDDTRKQYNAALDKIRNAPVEKKDVEGMKMEKQEIKPRTVKDMVKSNLFAVLVAAGVILLLFAAIIIGNRKKKYK